MKPHCITENADSDNDTNSVMHTAALNASELQESF